MPREKITRRQKNISRLVREKKERVAVRLSAVKRKKRP